MSKSPRSRRYSRWRAGTLTLVYLLVGIHIAHWKLTGRTLAPLELNEVMYTLELGIVTAGFLFMATAVLGTLFFGRFFCSWGCHILALEDLCSYLLNKLGIQPRRIRSRLLLWVPPAALFYMFVWPQVSRLIDGRPLPLLHVAQDADGWASFMTNDFWRNLPSVGVALFTFAVCGFAIVYFLGSRSFCRFACPYGALFALADRFSPGRLISLDGCTGCGKCTANCQSDVLVYEELAAYGTVVDSACMKDLDCVAGCPAGAIAYGFTKPAGLRKKNVHGAPQKSYDFSLGEEILQAIVFLFTLFTYRGLYGLVPFLLALALGCIFGYFSMVWWRLVQQDTVSLNKRVLKVAGRLMPRGWLVASIITLVALFSVHSAVYQFSLWRGKIAYQRFQAGELGAQEEALSYLNRVYSMQLIATPGLEHVLAELYRAGAMFGEPDR